MRTILIMLALAGCSPAELLNSTVSTNGLSITHAAYMPGARGGLDIYRPPDAARLPIVVFLYGGSWRSGSKEQYPFVAAPLARRGAVVVVPDYRVFPEVAFPNFLRDNAVAIAWVASHAAELGGDPARLFIVAHSAGAYDAAMLALDPSYLLAAGFARSRLAGVAALAGPYDFLPIVDPDIIPVFAPVQDGPLSQPIHFVDGHNPPMLLLTGDADTTVNPRNTAALNDAIKAAGGPVTSKVYHDLGHIGLVTAFAPLFQRRAPVLDDVWAFIQAARPAG